ncbi:hypothetical protein FUAX_06610 [Fulvitalea axinellae]|uniref:Uncharacterized protein n=1 Tax=Fulvitalea axinellae TaxID=1182444 RepID=A0AAU9CPE3_9BACT|nr:hypothetical protein FUAX_06610 [Fulvitalea axinellae]
MRIPYRLKKENRKNEAGPKATARFGVGGAQLLKGEGFEESEVIQAVLRPMRVSVRKTKTMLYGFEEGKLKPRREVELDAGRKLLVDDEVRYQLPEGATGHKSWSLGVSAAGRILVDANDFQPMAVKADFGSFMAYLEWIWSKRQELLRSKFRAHDMVYSGNILLGEPEAPLYSDAQFADLLAGMMTHRPAEAVALHQYFSRKNFVRSEAVRRNPEAFAQGFMHFPKRRPSGRYVVRHRVYINVKQEHLGTVADFLLRNLVDCSERRAFNMKVCCSQEIVKRRESIVLFFSSNSDFMESLPILKGFATAHPDYFIHDLPAMTLPIAHGVGYGEEPIRGFEAGTTEFEDIPVADYEGLLETFRGDLEVGKAESGIGADGKFQLSQTFLSLREPLADAEGGKLPLVPFSLFAGFEELFRRLMPKAKLTDYTEFLEKQKQKYTPGGPADYDPNSSFGGLRCSLIADALLDSAEDFEAFVGNVIHNFAVADVDFFAPSRNRRVS